MRTFTNKIIFVSILQWLQFSTSALHVFGYCGKQGSQPNCYGITIRVPT